MVTYESALAALNSAQRQAVETIDGPVLVIAGPGTGKTQLLATRIAHILQKTDTLPQNILCLTFTESGAENMRERLTRFIGQAAYNVTISTYHAFGREIISRFPEAFSKLRLESPISELMAHQVLMEIVERMRYDNPLKQTQHHLGDLIGTISEVKRALLNADSLRAIAAENQTFIADTTKDVHRIFKDVGMLPRSVAKALPLFEALLADIQKHAAKTPIHPRFGSLASIAAAQLKQALTDAEESGKTTPLTAWKNGWLEKDADNALIFGGKLQNERITALADVCEEYDATLEKNGWFDFDDMIMLAGKALQDNPELRYTLQEQYLYILLDEFQDTNAAQFKLVELLTDNPVHEGRPNVLAVGDDDQAIYAFQGAEYSNMRDFYQKYRDVSIVNLTDNYRSSQHILSTAQNISGQIASRLTHHFEGITKKLVAKNDRLLETDLERRDFLSDVAQYDWIASRIEKLIRDGCNPREVAVLAPKHQHLEALVPYLTKRGVPVRYEKRENILEAPVIKQLLTMSRLVLAIHDNDEVAADSLWPTVLSYDFWNIPVRTIWQTSWDVRDNNATWSRTLLGNTDPALATPALLLSTLALKVEEETCERMIDYLLGTEAINIHESGEVVRSPLRDFYLGEQAQSSMPGLLYETLSHLTVLRARLRDFQANQNNTLTLVGLVNFVDMYNQAGQRMQSTSPYNQQADAVQLMTVFKAKGLEFGHVFLPNCHDDVWGSSARGGSNKLTLPANIAPIRHAGATDDERLRILFVAITRAKFGLHLTGFKNTYSGAATKRLKYLDEQEQDDGTFKSLTLPEHAQLVVLSDHEAPELSSLELNWQQRHISARADTTLNQLLKDRLKRYQLSPTHVTRFVDLVYGGPDSVFFNNILGFPTAPSTNSQFGDAIHQTLEWIQHKVDTERTPDVADVLLYFAHRLEKCQFTSEQRQIEHDRGAKALRAYLDKNIGMFKPGDKAEYKFKGEGVFVGDAHLSGKIDRLEIDHHAKEIVIADYKTGKNHTGWGRSDTSLHKYRLQLYLYRALVEGSHSFKGYRVTGAYLDFVEPDTKTGQIHRLELKFDDNEYKRVQALAQAIWQRLTTINLPNVLIYSQDLKGMEAFEKDLLSDSPQFEL